MKFTIIIFAILMICTKHICAQQDSVVRESFISSYSGYIASAALISYGVIGKMHDELREIDEEAYDEVLENINRRYRVDDYIQYAPAIAVYGLDLIGVKAKHNVRDRTIVMATSHLIMFGTVRTSKIFTNIERPDGSNFKSFPSGHTAMAFTGAHVVFKEYKDASLWVGLSGYAVATATGLLRVVNNKHWISDVAAGAGVGVISAELGYLLLPIFQSLLGDVGKDKGLVVAPVAGSNHYGIGMVYTF